MTRQSESENEVIPKGESGGGRSGFMALRFILLFLLFGFVIQIFLFGFVYYKPDVFPTLANLRLYKSVSEYLEGKFSSDFEKKTEVGQKGKTKEYSFSQKQIAKAQKEVLSQKKEDSSTKSVVKIGNELTKHMNDNAKYRYDIEFISGGRIQTNNVIIEENMVTFENKKGLVVSMSKDEILSMKRTLVKRKSNTTNFRCSGKVYCSQMTSCEEAKFYNRNCPGTKLDGDHNGKPCEKQWCGN